MAEKTRSKLAGFSSFLSCQWTRWAELSWAELRIYIELCTTFDLTISRNVKFRKTRFSRSLCSTNVRTGRFWHLRYIRVRTYMYIHLPSMHTCIKGRGTPDLMNMPIFPRATLGFRSHVGSSAIYRNAQNYRNILMRIMLESSQVQ